MILHLYFFTFADTQEYCHLDGRIFFKGITGGQQACNLLSEAPKHDDPSLVWYNLNRDLSFTPTPAKPAYVEQYCFTAQGIMWRIYLPSFTEKLYIFSKDKVLMNASTKPQAMVDFINSSYLIFMQAFVQAKSPAGIRCCQALMLGAYESVIKACAKSKGVDLPEPGPDIPKAPPPKPTSATPKSTPRPKPSPAPHAGPTGVPPTSPVPPSAHHKVRKSAGMAYQNTASASQPMTSNTPKALSKFRVRTSATGVFASGISAACVNPIATPKKHVPKKKRCKKDRQDQTAELPSVYMTPYVSKKVKKFALDAYTVTLSSMCTQKFKVHKLIFETDTANLPPVFLHESRASIMANEMQDWAGIVTTAQAGLVEILQNANCKLQQDELNARQYVMAEWAREINQHVIVLKELSQYRALRTEENMAWLDLEDEIFDQRLLVRARENQEIQKEIEEIKEIIKEQKKIIEEAEKQEESLEKKNEEGWKDLEEKLARINYFFRRYFGNPTQKTVVTKRPWALRFTDDKYNKFLQDYKISNVPKDFDLNFFKKIFRQKILELHPDKQLDNPNADTEFKAFYQAYEYVIDTYGP